MGKRRKANNSKHVKTRHKRSLINRKVVNEKVEAGIKNINKFVSDAIKAEPKKDQNQPHTIEVEAMNMADFQKLLGNNSEPKKEKIGKFSIDDEIYL